MNRKHVRGWALRRGFTLVELLVVLAIIILLISLIFPAVTGSLRRARQLQCLNNLRGISQVALLYNQRFGRLPYANGHNPTDWKKEDLDLKDIKQLMDEMRLPAAIWYCPELGRQGSDRTPAHPDSWTYFTANSSKVIIGYVYVANPTGYVSKANPDAWQKKWVRNPKYYSRISESSRAPLAADICLANRIGSSTSGANADWVLFPHDGYNRPRVCNVVRMDGSAELVPVAQIAKAFEYLWTPTDLYWPW